MEQKHASVETCSSQREEGCLREQERAYLADKVPITTNPEGESVIPEKESTVVELLEEEIDDEAQYPTGFKSFVILAALCLSLLTIAVDETIIATAIPKITDEFKSVHDIGWYGSSYFLTETALQPTFGRIYTAFGIKQTFIVSIVIFEIGSLICATAPSSTALIVGRSIAGSGTGGIWSGSLLIVAYSFPLRKRPAAYGATSIIWTSATIGAPILGGLLADKATWRWCFYINLPIGAFAIIICALYLHIKRDSNPNHLTWRERLRSLDLLGASLLIPSVICLLLALQWGGTTYPWSNFRIILLLLLSVSLITSFIALQLRLGRQGTTPPHLFKNPTNSLAFTFAFLFGCCYFSLVYYLPVYFQAVQDVSPLQSAVHMLPLLVSAIVSSMGVGLVHSKLLKEKPAAKASSAEAAATRPADKSDPEGDEAMNSSSPTQTASISAESPTTKDGARAITSSNSSDVSTLSGSSKATPLQTADRPTSSSSSGTARAPSTSPKPPPTQQIEEITTPPTPTIPLSKAPTISPTTPPPHRDPAKTPPKHKHQLYNLTLTLSTLLLSITIPLLTLFSLHTPLSTTLPLLLFTGLSIGPLFTASQMLVQSALPSTSPDLPSSTALASFFQTLGGSLGLSFSQLVFKQGLIAGLKRFGTGVESEVLLEGGGSDIRGVLEGVGKVGVTDEMLKAWVEGLRGVWWFCGGCTWGGLGALVGTLLVAFRVRKGRSVMGRDEEVASGMIGMQTEKEEGNAEEKKKQDRGEKNRSDSTLVEASANV